MAEIIVRRALLAALADEIEERSELIVDVRHVSDAGVDDRDADATSGDPDVPPPSIARSMLSVTGDSGLLTTSCARRNVPIWKGSKTTRVGVSLGRLLLSRQVMEAGIEDSFSFVLFTATIWVFAFLVPKAIRERDLFGFVCAIIAAVLALAAWLLIGIGIGSA